MPIRLVIADDHPLILDGLENLFALEKDLQVVARCTDGTGTMEAVQRYRPDVLVLDIRMPGKDGLEIAREIREENLPTRVVILTAALDEDEMYAAIRLGVQGVVLKEMAPRLLVQCIRNVHEGKQWIERHSAKKALEKMLQKEKADRETAEILTPREIDIVRMVTQGLRNREIAEKLFISEGTVKTHLHNIYEKINVDSRMALLRYAQEKGLV